MVLKRRLFLLCVLLLDVLAGYVMAVGCRLLLGFVRVLVVAANLYEKDQAL